MTDERKDARQTDGFDGMQQADAPCAEVEQGKAERESTQQPARESASISAQRSYDTTYYNHAGAQELMERFEQETLLMQGPMGSILMSEPGGAEVPPAFWNCAEPQTVRRIHELYVDSGAQVLLTNTFQASEPALERDAIVPPMREVNRAAVDTARAAHGELVVGSIGPCGIDWLRENSPEYRAARAVYRNQAHALFAAGVDAVMLETFTSIRDLQPALTGARDVADGMPVFVSFAIADDGTLLGDGLTLEGAVIYAEKHGARAVGVNCCSVAAADAAVPRMIQAARTPVMVRPNVGDPSRDIAGALVWHEDSEAFAAACLRWGHAGAHLVGSCCGASPVTTAAMADALLYR